MQTIHAPKTLDFALLMMMALVWSSSFTVMKFLVADLSPPVISMLRTGIAAVVMLPFLWGKKLPSTTKEWGMIISIGIVGNAIPFTLIPFGEIKVDSGLAGILMAIGPVFALLLNHFFTQDDRITSRKFIGIVLGLSGVVLLLWKSILAGNIEQIPSIFAILLASCSYVCSGILIRHMAHVDSLVMTSFSMLSASIFIAPLAFAWGDIALDSLSKDGLLAVLYLGIVPTACAFFMRFTLIVRTGYTFFSYVGYIIPAFSLILGWIFFAEVISIEKIFALVCILSGLSLFRAPKN